MRGILVSWIEPALSHHHVDDLQMFGATSVLGKKSNSTVKVRFAGVVGEQPAGYWDMALRFEAMGPRRRGVAGQGKVGQIQIKQYFSLTRFFGFKIC